MKIERKENSGLVEFGSLKCGDVFSMVEKGEELIFFKFEINDDCDNAVCLDNCDRWCFDSEELVKHYPNAKLVLED